MEGVGAAPVKTAQGSGALDLDKMNSSALMTGFPAAESFAIKDAAEKLGRIFGSDLNRKDVLSLGAGYWDKVKENYWDKYKK
ncbi:MAG: hypothetical protein KatS3mg031_2862 [Chitinophagales bacterium]|nr:MAG: hypothetical protein KatS3mg031_2862 [Chitinophagales bacterium]